MKKTVIVTFGSTELKRYEIDCDPGPGESEADYRSRIILAAQMRFEADGFGRPDTQMALFAFADEVGPATLGRSGRGAGGSTGT